MRSRLPSWTWFLPILLFALAGCSKPARLDLWSIQAREPSTAGATNVPIRGVAVGVPSPRVVSALTGKSQVIQGDSTGYHFGHTVAGIGDLDGDGFSDVLVGAFGAGTNASGQVQLFRGSVNGLEPKPWWTFTCDAPGAEFGHQVEGVGDVNRDGIPDFAAGATYLSVPGKPRQSGGAFVFLGGRQGPRLAPGWPVAGEEAESSMGFTVAWAGDVNGDDYDDVLVGAHRAAKDRSQDAPLVGRVMLYPGGPDGPSTSPMWSPSGEKNASAFGYSVHGAGDVNGDGYADVVVGSYGYESSFAGAGRAYVYYGGPAGPHDHPDWTITGSQGGQMTGNSVCAAGDVDGDGFDDLVMGANGTSGLAAYGGAVLVMLGGTGGLSHQVSWCFEANEPSMFVGHSVAGAGDLNGDGVGDLVFSAADGRQLLQGEGMAFVCYGSKRGLDAHPSWSFRGGQMLSKYGATVRGAGDINGDGFADIVVGQPNFSGAVPRQGCVWVHYGSARGLGDSSHWPSGMHPGWSSYLTWVAVCVAAMSIITLLVSRYRYLRHDRAMAVAAGIREQARIEERHRISQDLHDQLGAELTGMAIASANARHLLGNAPQGDAKLAQIESTASRLVEALAEIVWVTRPTNDNLEATMGFVADLVSAGAEKAGFRCLLDLPMHVPDIRVGYEFRHDLVLWVKEAMHNAIQHSGGATIRLDVRLEGHLLYLTLRDDGRWLESGSATTRGNGLGNMADRIARLGGLMRIDTSPTGTAIVAEVPLPRDPAPHPS